MRTCREVEKHLEAKGYSEAEIIETLNELIGRRYIDDYLYAVRFFEYNREKKRGSLRAARELEEKGIDTETIRNAREDFLYENEVDEFRDALDFAVKDIMQREAGRLDSGGCFVGKSISPETGSPEISGGNDSDDRSAFIDSRTAASVARKLETRGFARDTIYKVLDRLRETDRIELS